MVPGGIVIHDCHEVVSVKTSSEPLTEGEKKKQSTQMSYGDRRVACRTDAKSRWPADGCRWVSEKWRLHRREISLRMLPLLQLKT